MRLSTHAGKLERWLGVDEVERISLAMKDWYGPPIAVANVPGLVWAHRGGDFRGPIRSGHAVSLLDMAVDRLKRSWKHEARRQMVTANTGFASLSDLIAEYSTGKGQTLYWNKLLNTQTVAVTSSMWRIGPQPAAGAAGSAAPGGRACTSATVGALPFVNAAGGDTLHWLSGFGSHSVGGSVLLYDRLFDVAKTMASTSTQAVTGVPTRYQSTTGSNPDYIGGNFLFVQVGTTQLAATAHNWTVCTYDDQANAASTLPSLAGNSGAIIDRLDHPVGQWFAPLESGDSGIAHLTQMQCSASVATGLIDFVIGHPIAWFPCPLALLILPADGIRGAFQLARIFDDACLSFLNVTAMSTGTPVFTGTMNLAAG